MTMQKYIKRRLTFTRDEVRDALIWRLGDQDHPYPMPNATEVKFDLGEDGAVLQWAEETDV
jgi:hypothetical protein